MDASQLRAELAQFNNGFDRPYHHSLVKSFLYSPGVRSFAQNAGRGAYWLLDLLATQPEVRQSVHDHGFVVIVLKVVGTVGQLTVARDMDEEGNFDTVAYTRTIDYTDCPEGEWKFYYENGVVMLPSEH